MSVRMRHTRAHTRNRRSHHSIKEPRFSVCPNCNTEHVRHHVCAKCGQYRKREVVNVIKKAEKIEKKRKAREKVQ